VILGVLFLISEIIGLSQCKANGVAEFIVSGIPCLGGDEMRVRFEEVPNAINRAESERNAVEYGASHPRVMALR